jgi:MerR family redox-sensitive transcriptional activator SoxR
MPTQPQLRIGEVAERAGIATSTIRFYESIGLLPEADRESGQRRYGDEVFGTLGFIAAAREAGLTLREIGDLMHGIEGQGTIAGPLRAVSTRKLPDVRETLERARRTEAWLEAAERCTCATQDECALFPEPGAEVRLDIVHVTRDGCRRRARV